MLLNFEDLNIEEKYGKHRFNCDQLEHDCLNIVIFNNDGSVMKAIHLSSDGDIYYKLQEPMYHTVIPLTDYVIYHEITDGPFMLDDKDEAKWAPRKENSLEVLTYQKEIIGKI